jgi:hypothetical protein
MRRAADGGIAGIGGAEARIERPRDFRKRHAFFDEFTQRKRMRVLPRGLHQFVPEISCCAFFISDIPKQVKLDFG